MTRSRITGKVRSGVTVTVSSSSNVDIRVMHSSRGRPLTSAEQEPHLPALQFHRTARSGRLGGLQPVDDVEHHLALVDLDGVVLQLAAVVVAAPDPEFRVVGSHDQPFRSGCSASSSSV